MFVPKRIHRLVAWEVMSLTLVLLAALTSVLFLFHILRYSEYIFGTSEGVISILFFVVFLFPGLFKMTVPLSLLLSTSIVIGRMSQDRELEAWMGAGAGVFEVLKAPFILGVICCMGSLLSGLYLEPHSRQELNRYRWLYAQRGVEQMIETRLHPQSFFFGPLDGEDSEVCLYVDKLVSAQQGFQGVFLSVKRTGEKLASVLVADEGAFRREKVGGASDYVLDLQNGTIYEPIGTKESLAYLAETHADHYRVPSAPTNPQAREFLAKEPGVAWRVVRFSRFRVSLVGLFRGKLNVDAPDGNDIRTKVAPAYWAKLKEIRKDPKWKQHPGQIRDFTFFYEQIAVAIACLFLPVIGVCLGIQDPRRRAGSIYIGVGFVVVLFYSAVMLSNQFPVKRGVEPEMMLVAPPLTLLFLSLIVVRMKVAYPPSTSLREFLASDFRRAFGWLTALGSRR